MKLEEIKVADIDTLEARTAEILSENSEELTVEELEARADESEAIEERMKELRAAYTREQEVRAAVANGTVTVVEIKNDIPQEERKMDVKEIRNSNDYIEAYAEGLKSGDFAEVILALSAKEIIGSGMYSQ